jgi:hypothetical protein
MSFSSPSHVSFGGQKTGAFSPLKRRWLRLTHPARSPSAFGYLDNLWYEKESEFMLNLIEIQKWKCVLCTENCEIDIG